MELKEKFLPIGSVVLLQGGTKRIMITGFCSIAEDDKTKVYDYSGCVYPEGYLNSNQVCLFDHDQISELFHLGYECDEETEFKKSLRDIIEKYNSGDIEGAKDRVEDEVEDLEYL